MLYSVLDPDEHGWRGLGELVHAIWSLCGRISRSWSLGCGHRGSVLAGRWTCSHSVRNSQALVHVSSYLIILTASLLKT